MKNTDESSARLHTTEAIYYHNDVFGAKILARILGPYLRGEVLEVGAGAGFITTEIGKRSQHVVAIEPTVSLFSLLRERVQSSTTVSIFNGTLQSFVNDSRVSTTMPRLYDSIVYINVLEHIENDIDELALAKSLLKPDGTVLIVVPAHQWLYARIDHLTGHFRRYSRKSITSTISSSGLSARSVKYFDAIGVIPYLILYKWMRSTATSGSNATIYSRVIMPTSHLVYWFSRGRIIGKNLIAVAEMPTRSSSTA